MIRVHWTTVCSAFLGGLLSGHVFHREGWLIGAAVLVEAVVIVAGLVWCDGRFCRARSR